MEETELEEGEACFYDNDASIDPDTALSYIDKRLQNVLGHFRKDFEDGVSAEILGPKYGGYGSFLPSQKQPRTVLSHTKTSQNILNSKKLCSPHNFRLENAPLNSVTPAEPVLAVRPDVAAAFHHTDVFLDQNALSADNSASKDTSSLGVSIGETLLSKNETTTSNSANPTEQRSLKVRIKVGSEKLARTNAAIYSGLGLLSPSSSTGNNPEDSGGTPTESHDIPCDSPGSILRDMASIFVPGNRLLSPLNESLLCLKRTEKILENKLTPIMGKKISSSIFLDDSSSVLGEGKPMEGKEVSSRDKSEVLEGMKYKNSTGFEGDKAPFSEGMETESLDNKQCLTNDFKVKLSSDSVSCTGGMLNAAVTTSEANRAAKKDVPVKKRETKKEWLKDQLFGPDFMRKESEAVCGSYEQKDVKHSSIEHTEETKARASSKKLSLDSRESGRIKGNVVHSVCKNDPDVSKHETDRFEKKVGSKATTRESHEVKVPHGIGKFSFERKNKFMGIQSSGISPSKLVKENSRSGLSGAMKDKKSAQKNILRVRNSYKDILDTRVEDQNNQTKALEMRTGNEANHCELGVGKGKHAWIKGFSAEAVVPLQIEVAPAAPTETPPDNWVGCDSCEKWRLLPIGIEPENLPDKWLCSMSTWLPGRNHCDISEDETTRVVQEMNLHLISQKQDSLQYDGSRAISGVAEVNIGHSDHTNSNVNLETMPNRWKKNKSRPEGSSSGLIQTSHLSMDAQQHRLKRKSLSEANQPLPERNIVNKSIALHPSKSNNFAVGRHAAKVNGKDVNGGGLKPKKLISKTGSDHYDYLTSNKISTEAAPNTDGCRNNEPVRDLGGTGFSPNPTLPSMADERDMEQDSEQLYSSNGDHQPRDRLLISVKKQTDSTQVSMKSKLLDMRSSEKVEMHAKKRKLKDWQDSQPYANTLESSEGNLPDTKTREKSNDRIGRKEKRLKTYNTQVKESTANKGEGSFSHKGKMMKIILPASKDNSVDRSHEKNQQQDKHREKVTSRSNLNDPCSSRKDLESERILLAATSSSSKVSGSCRRASLQERKESPVESVSSSPMKALNLDKLSPAAGRTISRKGHAKSGDTGTEIPRKLLAREANMEGHRSIQDLHDIDASQRFGGKVESKLKEASKIRNSRMIKYDTDIVMEQATGQSDLQALDHCRSDGRMSMEDDANGAMIPQSSGKGSSSMSKDKDRRSSFQRVKVKASDPLTEQEPFPNKMRRVEVDVVHCGPASNPEVVGDGRWKYSNESSTKISNDGKSVGKKISKRRTSDSIGDEKPTSLIEHAGSEAKLGDMGSLEVKPTVKKDLRKVFVADISKKRDSNEVEPKGQKAEVTPCSAAKQSELALVGYQLYRSLEVTGLDVQAFDGSGQNVLKVLKHPVDAANQNAKSLVTDCGTMKDLGVISFVKEYASSQTAMSAFKRAEESKDYADRIKISGFVYECNDAYFDSALKFLYTASLLEACSTDFSKSKGVDPVNVYSTSAKLCKICAQEYEKQKEFAAAALAYKCMEVAYMRIVYCKSSVTRQDLQTSLQMVTQGESPSSSASDVDNLNNQATMDKTMLSKSIAHPGNHVVARNQANFVRLLDFTSDVSLAMEASMNTQNAYAAASAILVEAQKKEMIISVKRVVDFSFQDVKELVCLVQHAREAINRQGFRGNNRE